MTVVRSSFVEGPRDRFELHPKKCYGHVVRWFTLNSAPSVAPLAASSAQLTTPTMEHKVASTLHSKQNMYGSHNSGIVCIGRHCDVGNATLAVCSRDDLRNQSQPAFHDLCHPLNVGEGGFRQWRLFNVRNWLYSIIGQVVLSSPRHLPSLVFARPCVHTP